MSKQNEDIDLSALDDVDLSALDEVDLSPSDETSARPSISKLESLGRGAQQGVTMGFGDEISGGINALLHAGSKVLPYESGYKDLSEAYSDGRDTNRGENKAAQDANGKMYFAGEMAGGVASSLMPGGAALNAAKGAKIGTVAAKGALQGGLSGLGGSESETVGGNVIDASKGATLGALTGAAGSKVGDVMDWLAKKTATYGAKGLITASKPVDKYLVNPDKYQAKENVETVSEKLLPYFRGKEELADKAAVRAGNKATEAVRMRAEAEAAKDLSNRTQETLLNKMKMTEPTTQAKDALKASLEGQRSKVSGLASEQSRMLSETDATIDMSKILDGLQTRAKNTDLKGMPNKLSGEANDIRQMIAQMTDVRDAGVEKGAEYTDDILREIQSEGLQWDPKSAVNLRQTLQDFSAPAFGPNGPYVPKGAAAAKEANAGINSLLDAAGDALPGYKDLRGKLARETKLSTEAAGNLSNPDLGKTLSSMSDQGMNFDTLKRLDANNGKQILPELAPYLSAKGKLNNPQRLDSFMENLPQAKKASEASKVANDFDWMAERAKTNAVKAAQETKVGGINSANVDKKLREAMLSNEFNPKMENFRDLDKLAEKAGVPVRDLVDILQVRSAFGKEGAQGSRLVNWLSKAAPESVQGLAATTGAVLDVTRGTAAKGLLDGYLKAQPAIKGVGDALGKSNASKSAMRAGVMNAQQDKEGDTQYQALMDMLKGKEEDKK